MLQYPPAGLQPSEHIAVKNIHVQDEGRAVMCI